MGLVKRGRYWHFYFEKFGRRYQGSTHQTNKNKAKDVESKIRSEVALERFELLSRQSPLFSDFMRVKKGEIPDGKFLEYIRLHTKPNTIEFYSNGCKALLKFPGFQGKRLSEIKPKLIIDYEQWRSGQVEITTLNAELRCLRRAMKLAYEWEDIRREVKVHVLPGERGRTFTLSAELERQYLELATYPLREASILMLDLGLRPQECVRLRKSDISGAATKTPALASVAVAMEMPAFPAEPVTVREGKTANATRTLPLTERAKQIVELLKEHPDFGGSLIDGV